MTAGRHRRSRHRVQPRKLAVGAAGALGATTLVIPLTPGLATAATLSDVPHRHAPQAQVPQPDVPQGPGDRPQRPDLPAPPGGPDMPAPPDHPDHPDHPGLPSGPHVPNPVDPDDGGSNQTRGERVVEEASDQYGHPYMYGGSGPVVFDCSGLTKYVYNQFGVKLPHNSAAQYQVVDHVKKSNMRLGDLVFIYDEDGIFHVGIYAGGQKMWAATKTGDIVRKETIWTDSFVVGRPS